MMDAIPAGGKIDNSPSPSDASALLSVAACDSGSVEVSTEIQAGEAILFAHVQQTRASSELSQPQFGQSMADT